MKLLISTSKVHDRSKPRGLSLDKVAIGDTFKNEPTAVALNKGVAVRKGSSVVIDKIWNGSRRSVSLSKAELTAALGLFK